MCVCSRLTRAGRQPRRAIGLEQLVEPSRPAKLLQIVGHSAMRCRRQPSGGQRSAVRRSADRRCVRPLTADRVGAFAEAHPSCPGSAALRRRSRPARRSRAAVYGGFGVEDLADRADARLAQVLLEAVEQVPRAAAVVRDAASARHRRTARSARPRRSPGGRPRRAPAGRRSTSPCSPGGPAPASAGRPASAAARARPPAPAPSARDRAPDGRARSRTPDSAGTPGRRPLRRRRRRTGSRPRRTRSAG